MTSNDRKIRISVSEDISIDAFEMLSAELGEVQFASFAQLQVEKEEHDFYSLNLPDLVELVIEPAKIVAPVLSIVTSIISLLKLRNSSGRPPKVVVEVSGKRITVEEGDAEKLRALLENPTKDETDGR
ncbi:MAG TPA: hypothetical protein VGC13_11325 [Longimicrobium sp.]|jgi:hypothetical protein|uniref:hypothetical protein n=1 Tax=Longimicrobium sp. TaxID=2029185 RepID=UPI002EDAC314